MRRFAALMTGAGISLMVTGLFGSLPALGGAQEASPAADTSPQAQNESPAVAPEFGAEGVDVEVLGRTDSLLRDQERRLTLFRISWAPGAQVSAREYLSTQIFAVEEGSVVLTVSEVDPETTGTILQRQRGEPCAGAGCDIQGIVNQELVLNAGDSISHDGRVVYEYRDAAQAGRAGYTAAAAQAGGGKGTRACASGCG